MYPNQYNNIVEALEDLKSRGFSAEFLFDKESEKMKCPGTGKFYAPDEMFIVEYHRFEGDSNPADMSIVVALECKDKTKAVLVSPYGTYADRKLLVFISKVKIKQQAAKL